MIQWVLSIELGVRVFADLGFERLAYQLNMPDLLVSKWEEDIEWAMTCTGSTNLPTS